MELGYIGRFDHKVRETGIFRDPLQGRNHRVSNWESNHSGGSERDRLDQLLAKNGGVRNESAQMPQNLFSSYEILKPNRNQLGFSISAYGCAHLQTFVENGFDTIPLQLGELLGYLNAAIERAERTKTALVVAFTSPTGWSEEAVDYISGSHGTAAFHHRFVIPFLVDQYDGTVIRDKLDERATDYDRIFTPYFRHELIERARLYTRERLFSTRRSASASEIAQSLNLGKELVEEAFKELEQNEQFTLVNLDEIGLVIGLPD